MNPRTLKKLVIGIVILVLVLILNPYVKVDAGERGVVVNMGNVSENVLNEGPHFRIPVYQKVRIIDVSILKVEAKADAASIDQQSVFTDVALNFKVDPSRANKLFQEYKGNHIERVVLPAIQEKVKAATAQFTAEELITKRPEVKIVLHDLLSERLAKSYMIVEDIAITNFKFSESFDAAIEAKQTAEQDALKAENELRRIEIEAEQKIATARAEAESIKIKAQAVQQQGGKDYVQLQAIEKWNGILPTSMIPGGTVPFLELTR